MPEDAFLPCWFSEGEPEWVQASISSTFAEYLKAQNLQPYYLTQDGRDFKATTARTWKATEVAKYLRASTKNPDCGKTSTYALAYSLGAVLVEALASIGGSESVFRFHQLLVDNATPYDDAFKQVYGTTWDLAVPILSKVIAAKITRAWGPRALTYQTRPKP
jgi:hypothetical protein